MLIKREKYPLYFDFDEQQIKSGRPGGGLTIVSPDEFENKESRANWNGISALNFVVKDSSKKHWYIADILRYAPSIQGLRLDKSASGIAELPKQKTLISLDLSERLAADELLDISEMPHLLELSVRGKASKNIVNLSDSKLTSLTLWNSGFKEAWANQLRGLDKLRHLSLVREDVEDFTDAPELPELVSLEIAYCRELSSLDGLSKLAPNLKELRLETSPNIKCVNGLISCKEIRHLFLHAPEKIEDLNFCLSMNGLISLNLANVNVLDGRLQQLENIETLKHVFFVNKRHYDTRCEILAAKL